MFDTKKKAKKKYKMVVGRALVSGLTLAALVISSVYPALATEAFHDVLKSSNENNSTVLEEARYQEQPKNYFIDTINKAQVTVEALYQEEKETFQNALVESFSDVGKDDWYYDSVTTMAKARYFAGKGEIVDGVGRFYPYDAMSRAEFLTVVARILYGEDSLQGVGSNASGEAWWKVYYTALLEDGVISAEEFRTDTIENPMTRQEMSLVAVRALAKRGEVLETVHPNVEKNIPDYASVNPLCREAVAKGYQLGLLCGIDSVGTFLPLASLKRAEATQVLYRMIEPSARLQKDFSAEAVSSGEVGQQIIREGELSIRVPAQEGDIFIKKDGTQVVLKKGPNGVVGEGQCVAPDIGMYGTVDGYVMASNEWKNSLHLYQIDEKWHPYFVDARGRSLNNDTYWVNATTGEGHWGRDWQILAEAVGNLPDYDGTYDGEISKDPYCLFKWHARLENWGYNMTDR